MFQYSCRTYTAIIASFFWFAEVAKQLVALTPSLFGVEVELHSGLRPWTAMNVGLRVRSSLAMLLFLVMRSLALENLCPAAA
jgi:hypothetical protein